MPPNRKRPLEDLGRRFWVNAAVLLLSLLFASACGVMSKVTQTAKDLSPIDFSGKEKSLKIGMIGFENRVTIPFKEFTSTAEAGMAAGLAEECSGRLFTFPGDPAYPAFLRHPPRLVNGQIDNLALARRGRQLGYNAVITGGLIDIDGYREERGFLWFKKNKSFVKLVVKLEVYDTRTAAKFVDRIASREINVEELESLPTSGKKDISDPALINAVNDLVSELSEQVCEALEDRPWVGYVTAVDGLQATISSGSDQGLSAGETLQVYDSTDIIEGAAGARFIQIGPKCGKLTITAVTPDHAEGEIEGHVTPGCSVTAE